LRLWKETSIIRKVYDVLELCFFVEWQTLCTAFGVGHCYLINKAQDLHWNSKLQTPHTIVNDFFDIPQDKPFVFVEKDVPPNREAIFLSDFNHPDDALYCFGGNACGMPYAWHERDTNVKGLWLTISPNSLWADQAAAIVLAHRGDHADN
jgi:hypothetical protein